MDSLFLKLYTTRSLLTELTSLFQSLHKKLKVQTKECRAKLPRQVFVSIHAPPLPVYNRFAILAEGDPISQMKTWADFITKPASAEDVAAVRPPRKPLPLHERPTHGVHGSAAPAESGHVGSVRRHDRASAQRVVRCHGLAHITYGTFICHSLCCHMEHELSGSLQASICEHANAERQHGCNCHDRHTKLNSDHERVHGFL